MTIRPLHKSDLSVLYDIHQRYYKNEFNFPDFFTRFIASFAIIDKDKLVVAGGILPIAESIILTNRDVPIHTRLEALIQTRDISKYIASQSGFSRVHAFAHEDVWKQWMVRAGFEKCPGEIFSIGVS